MLVLWRAAATALSTNGAAQDIVSVTVWFNFVSFKEIAAPLRALDLYDWMGTWLLASRTGQCWTSITPDN
jgi:hypothetical protein